MYVLGIPVAYAEACDGGTLKTKAGGKFAGAKAGFADNEIWFLHYAPVDHAYTLTELLDAVARGDEEEIPGVRLLSGGGEDSGDEDPTDVFMNLDGLEDRDMLRGLVPIACFEDVEGCLLLDTGSGEDDPPVLQMSEDGGFEEIAPTFTGFFDDIEK